MMLIEYLRRSGPTRPFRLGYIEPNIDPDFNASFLAGNILALFLKNTRISIQSLQFKITH